MLPHRFLVLRKPSQHLAVLVERQWSGSYYTFHIVEHPIQELHGMIHTQGVTDEWLEGQPLDFAVYRSSRRANATTNYHSQARIQSALVHPRTSEKIPVLTLDRPKRILPSAYTQLEQHPRFSVYITPNQVVTEEPVPQLIPVEHLIEHMQQQHIRPHVRIQQQVQPQVHRQLLTMPQHIVNAYLERLIQAHELCPISLEPLQRETAVLTPCGHGVSRREAERWIQDAHSCPVCREACSLAELMSWQ